MKQKLEKKKECIKLQSAMIMLMIGAYTAFLAVTFYSIAKNYSRNNLSYRDIYYSGLAVSSVVCLGIFKIDRKNNIEKDKKVTQEIKEIEAQDTEQGRTFSLE
jgi:hypothetical protein